MQTGSVRARNNFISVPSQKPLDTPFVMRYQFNGYKHKYTSRYGYHYNPTPSFSSLFAKLVDVRLLWLGAWGYTTGYLVAKSRSWQDMQSMLKALPAGWGFHTGRFEFWNSGAETSF